MYEIDTSCDDALARAYMALYTAKRQGRNRVAVAARGFSACT